MPLTNTYWQLVSVAGEEVPETDGQQKPHILFLDDGRVTGFSGCNQYMGNYQVRGENLLFDSMSSTRMACPENLTEELLFAALAKTVGVYLDGIELRLLGENGEELAVFEASRMK
ncbi:MAG: META domain-containing protein [Pseudomonadota bacterium]